MLLVLVKVKIARLTSISCNLLMWFLAFSIVHFPSVNTPLQNGPQFIIKASVWMIILCSLCIKYLPFANLNLAIQQSSSSLTKEPAIGVAWYEPFYWSDTLCSCCKFQSCICTWKTAWTVDDRSPINFVNSNMVA